MKPGSAITWSMPLTTLCDQGVVVSWGEIAGGKASATLQDVAVSTGSRFISNNAAQTSPVIALPAN